MKKMRLLVVLSLLLGLHAHATDQIPDMIVYGDAETSLLNNPLETFFEQNPDKRPVTSSTSAWRGYMARFEVENDQLFLDEVNIYEYNVDEGRVKLKNIIRELFRNKSRLKMDWYSGVLVIPDGKMKSRFVTGYDTKFDQYTILQIKNGDVVDKKVLKRGEYNKLMNRLFKDVKSSSIYDTIVANMRYRDPLIKDKDIELAVKQYVFDYITELPE